MYDLLWFGFCLQSSQTTFRASLSWVVTLLRVLNYLAFLAMRGWRFSKSRFDLSVFFASLDDRVRNFCCDFVSQKHFSFYCRLVTRDAWTDIWWLRLANHADLLLMVALLLFLFPYLSLKVSLKLIQSKKYLPPQIIMSFVDLAWYFSCLLCTP